MYISANLSKKSGEFVLEISLTNKVVSSSTVGFCLQVILSTGWTVFTLLGGARRFKYQHEILRFCKCIYLKKREIMK